LSHARIRQYSNLEQQLFEECVAMAQFALSQGFAIPTSIMDVLHGYEAALSVVHTEMKTSTETQTEITGQFLIQEKNDGDSTMAELNGDALYTLRDVVSLHARLAQIIAPVKPNVAVMITAHTTNGKHFKFLGSVPLIRHMMYISFLSLAGMFGVSVSPEVNGDPNNFSLLHNNGYSLLLNELFLLFAASLGASFNALFVADKYAREGIWNPSYETSYWIRYILGLLSGAMLATLIPIEEINTSTRSGSLNGFGGPILAVVGGFSSNVVYHIFSRMTETLESLVSGGVKEKIAIQERTSKAHIAEQTARERMLISARLMKLQTQIGSNTDPSMMRQELDRLHRELLALGTAEDLAETPPRPGQETGKAS
jgi:hypothetical protein